MSELPSHGTGYAESEAFMDVVALFNTWDESGKAPDFTVAKQRLHDAFNLNELRNLEAITLTLRNLIDRELTLRGSDLEYKNSADSHH